MTPTDFTTFTAFKERIAQIIASFVENQNPANLPVVLWLQERIKPEQDAEQFYQHVLIALKKNPSITSSKEKVTLLYEALCESGINVVDLLAQAIITHRPECEEIKTYCPSVSPYLESDQDGAITRYLKHIQLLDDLHRMNLSLPTFVVRTGRNNGLPYADSKARLYAVLEKSEHYAPYAACSPLMQACMPHWFKAMEAEHSDYPRVVAENFIRLFKNFDAKNIDDLYPQLRAFFMAMAKGFSTLAIADEPGDEEFLFKSESTFSKLEFSREERRIMARDLFLTRNFACASEGMRAVFDHPLECASLLAHAGIDQRMVQELISHTLFERLAAQNSFAEFKRYKVLVDDHDAALQAQGYASIKGTSALAGVLVHLDIAEQFEALGYLPVTPTRLHFYYCYFDKVEVHDKQTMSAAAERKMLLAIKLQQTALIKGACNVFFELGSNTKDDLTHPAAIKALLSSHDVDLGDFITGTDRFKQALAAGVEAGVLLQHPALSKYSTLALECDLGL
jgi:hypothetical protein